MVNTRIATDDVPVLTTFASDPAGPVTVLSTVMVAASPSSPSLPASPLYPEVHG